MPENENTVVETENNEVVTNEVTDVTTNEEKSLGQELLEWIVLAFIVGVIWQGISLAIKGVKKLVTKIKDKVKAKKASKEAAAPVAAPAANKEGIVVGDSAEQQ